MRKDSNEVKSQHDAVAAISAAHLLHPAKHFAHPRDVLVAADIGADEKRAILASWASDIFAIESVPALRLCPGTEKAISYDDIIEALKTLDRDGQQPRGQSSPASFTIGRLHGRRPQARRFCSLGLRGYRKGDRRRQQFNM